MSRARPRTGTASAGGEPWQVCGASRVGGSHLADKMPNQDSWRALGGTIGIGAVVCDGLGSKPHAQTGSRAGCRAIAEAFRLRRRYPASSDEHLIRSIHLLWSMRVAPLDPGDCATTCLFALAEPHGGLLLGQLGDGAILVEASDGGVAPIAADTDFAGPTTGLGVATQIEEWTLCRLEPGASRLIVLATDGVADDLIDNGLDRFTRYLRQEILGHPMPDHGARLASMLKSWPTPGYSDDKTIALLWRAEDTAG